MQPKIIFNFNTKKGMTFLEVLLDKIGGELNYMALLKLAFFSDRYSIRNFARPVSFDVYYAMKLGPVPSNLRDIIDVQIFIHKNIIKSPNEPYLVKLKNNNIDGTQLSRSDYESINFAVDNFGKFAIDSNPYLIANLTHAYPEWDEYKEQIEKDLNKRFFMDYRKFLLNAIPTHPEFKKVSLIDPYKMLTESERQDLLVEITEMNLLYGED